MKIERDNANSCFFKDVERGECLEYGEDIYLKTERLILSNDRCYNAISLETGFYFRFDDNDKVIIHENAKVVIE